jgi:tRNA threonylcarbamoyladenosine biosynthesis protein TsaE
LSPPPVEIDSACAEDTHELGRILGEHARPGDIFLLTGDLGAGKTTLTQGILWGMGSDDYVRSPTFVLATEYDASIPLHHVDLYRIDGVEEMDELGLDELVENGGVVVVEWAEKAAELFPAGRLQVNIERMGGDSRRLILSSTSAEYERFLDLLSGRPTAGCA